MIHMRNDEEHPCGLQRSTHEEACEEQDAIEVDCSLMPSAPFHEEQYMTGSLSTPIFENYRFRTRDICVKNGRAAACLATFSRLLRNRIGHYMTAVEEVIAEDVDVNSDQDDGLVEYERIRAANIARNRAVLEGLGVPKMVEEMTAKEKERKKGSKDKEPKPESEKSDRTLRPRKVQKTENAPVTTISPTADVNDSGEVSVQCC